MAHIDRLSIQGVRSFSHTDKAYIKFFSPLTLIVGQNGAGKTTIIECLKYATTGDFPPGTRTGAMSAFIHDPKVAGEREVKAVIGLKFIDVRGNQIIVHRRMQATQMANKIQAKTIESTILKDRHGERAGVSSRCVDVDREMVTLLGVSKAVLSNVIFCHQEESNWPLSDGKTLKTKFDEIFAATRYIKALENIRKFRKEQEQLLREYNVELTYMRERKDKAFDLEQDKETTMARSEAAKESCQRTNEKLEPIEERIEELQRLSHEWFELEKEIEMIAVQCAEKREQQRELKSRVKIREGTVAELELMLQTSHSRLQRQQEDLEKNMTRRQELAADHRDLSSTRDRLAREHGRLEQEAEAHSKLVVHRDQKMVELARQHNIPGFARGPFSSEQANSFKDILRKQIEVMRKDAKDMKEEHAQRQAALQQEIDKTRESLTKHREIRRQKSKQKADNQQRLEGIGRELRDADTAEAQLQIAELDVQQAEEALEAARAGSNVALEREQIAQLEAEKRSIDADINSLMQEITQANMFATKRAQLSNLQKQRLAADEKVKKFYRDNEEILLECFGEAQPDNLTTLFNEKHRAMKETQRMARQRQEQAQFEVRSKESDLVKMKQEVAKKRKILEDKKKRVSSVCPSLALEQDIEEIDQRLENIAESNALVLHAPKFWKIMRVQLERSHSCPVCDRGFNSADAESAIVAKLKQKSSSAVSHGDVKKEEEELRAKRKTLMALSPVVSEIRSLEKEVPDLQARCGALSKEVERLRQEYEEACEGHNLAETELQQVTDLQGSIQVLTNDQQELRRIDRELASHQDSLKGSSRPMHELTRDMKDRQLDSESKNRQLESKRKHVSDQEHQLLQLQKEYQEAKARQLEIATKLQKRQRLEEQKRELMSANVSLQREVQHLESQLNPLQERLEKKESERTQMKEEHGRKEDSFLRDVNDLRSNGKTFKDMADSIMEYVAQGKEKDVKRAQIQLDNAMQRLAMLEQDKTDVEGNIAKLNKEIASAQISKREIDDSISYKQREVEVAQLEEKSAALKTRLGQSNQGNLRRQRLKLEDDRKELYRERTQLETRHAQYEAEIQRIQRELTSDMYRGADAKYQLQHVKSKTTELANGDLEKYYKALDKAIMRYHGMKMEEINRIIRELWMNTYRGNDIDSIQIVSDVDEEGSSATKARRSYNYRVEMRKGDTALDMRGRCSAGQKVLASLIIRLALAETFCLSCGILALDEPTTNLDRDNIESLADALSDIIKHRRRQRNFQLVVITHDEEFVELLGRADFVDHYYRVAKDDSHCSKVWTHSISGLDVGEG